LATAHRSTSVGFNAAPPTFEPGKTTVSTRLDLVRSKGKLPARHGNFIGGNWIAPADGQYFTDYSPINGAGAGGLEAPVGSCDAHFLTRMRAAC
jgi:hypothetical protein